MTSYVQIHVNIEMSDYVSLAWGFSMWKILPVNIIFFVAKQQATSLSINSLDMLLHAQQVTPPNGYICDALKIAQTLT